MPKRSTVTYDRLTTMNAWQAALIETALERLIASGDVHENHAQRTLDEFRQFSQPRSIIRFNGE